MVDVSIVLPAYNEERAIVCCLERLVRYLQSESGGAGLWTSWEVVVVDDGSSDATGRLAREAAERDPRIRVVTLGANGGKGAAARAGVQAACGDLVLLTDVDLSYALADLGAAARALRRGQGRAQGRDGLDMVSGDRRHPASQMSFALSALGHVVRRQAISRLFNLCVRLAFGLRCRDTQCGLKGFRRAAAARVLSRVRTSRFLADVEMFLIARRLGLRVDTIPVHLTYLSVDSTVHVIRQAPRVLADALRIKLAQVLGRYSEEG